MRVKKNLFALLTSLLFLMSIFFSPNPVSAQVACCNEGTTYVDGECHPPLTDRGCQEFGDLLCSLGTGIVAPGCPNDTLAQACRETIAAGGNIGCGTLVTVLTGDIGIDFFTIPGLKEEAIGGCERLLGDGDITGSTFDDHCTDDQTCNDNGNCVSKVPFELCRQIPSNQSAAVSACETCAEVSENGNVSGVWTAIGCIPVDPTSMISTLMKVGLSISGGIALLMILSAGFMFSTSQGDPKKVGDAKELMTSAVIGLLFIIFSVTILQFIGVNLLQIPGFGG